jgi:hypothetical protein
VIITRAFSIRIAGWSTAALIPLIDMCNHAAEANLAWEYRADIASFVVTAKTDVPVGGQLTCSYGVKSQARYLINYGFTMPLIAGQSPGRAHMHPTRSDSTDAREAGRAMAAIDPVVAVSRVRVALTSSAAGWMVLSGAAKRPRTGSGTTTGTLASGQAADATPYVLPSFGVGNLSAPIVGLNDALLTVMERSDRPAAWTRGVPYTFGNGRPMAVASSAVSEGRSDERWLRTALHDVLSAVDSAIALRAERIVTMDEALVVLVVAPFLQATGDEEAATDVLARNVLGPNAAALLPTETAHTIGGHNAMSAAVVQRSELRALREIKQALRAIDSLLAKPFAQRRDPRLCAYLHGLVEREFINDLIVDWFAACR